MATAATRKQTEDAEDWMSLNEASAALGQARLTVVTRALAGEIDAKVFAKRVFVRRSSVEKAKAERITAAK